MVDLGDPGLLGTNGRSQDFFSAPRIHRDVILHPFLRSNLRNAFDLSLLQVLQENRAGLGLWHVRAGGVARSNQHSGPEDPGGIQMWLEVHFCIAVLNNCPPKGWAHCKILLPEMFGRSLYIHTGYRLSVCMYVCTYVCMYVWMSGCLDVWMSVCMHACMHACMYVKKTGHLLWNYSREYEPS